MSSFLHLCTCSLPIPSSFLHLLYKYSACFAVTAFLQDIFMESDLLLKGLDSVLVQPFIGLTVRTCFTYCIWLYDSISFTAVTYYCHDFFFFLWVTTIPLRFVFVPGGCFSPSLCFSYQSILLRTFSGKKTKLSVDKTSVSITTLVILMQLLVSWKEICMDLYILAAYCDFYKCNCLAGYRTSWNIISSGCGSRRIISSSILVIRPLSKASSITVIPKKLFVTSGPASLAIWFMRSGLLS